MSTSHGEPQDTLDPGNSAAEDVVNFDRDLDILVNSLVEAKLRDSKTQLDSQAALFRQQEADRITREIQLRQELEALKAQLVSAELASRSAAVRAQGSNTSTDVPPVGAPRKRRRRRQSTVPDVSQDSPARNTRSMRRATLEASAAALLATSAPVSQPVSQPDPQPAIPVQPVVSPNFVAEPESLMPVQPSASPMHTQAVDPAHSSNLAAPVNHSPSPATLVQALSPAPSPAEPRVQTRATANTARTAKPAKKPVVKAAAELYRALPQDKPKDLGGLQKAVHLHVRILWGLLDSKQTPTPPPDAVLLSFNSRFSNEAQLQTIITQESSPHLIPFHLIQIGTAMSAAKGKIANQARLVEEHMLSYMQACLSRFGLSRWCPDLRQSAYSLYNAACRLIALDTFRQALVAHTYIHLSPNTTYTKNTEILIKLFDHFVFHLMQKRHQREVRAPGSVLQELEATPVYTNRIRLAAARLKFLKDNNYPRRYRDLIDTKATSDDEHDVSRNVYVIKCRPERSQAAEAFFRILDEKRQAFARQQSSRGWKERVRVVPTSGQQDSNFRVLPDSMPVDYYDPKFFNDLQPKVRHRICIRKVAFLPLPEIGQSLTRNHPDESLGDVAFTRKYGKDVFERYRMVRDEDLVNDADDEGEGDSLDDEEGEGNWLDIDIDEDEDEDLPMDEDEDNMELLGSLVSSPLSSPPPSIAQQ